MRFQGTGNDERIHTHARHRATVDVDGVHLLRGHYFVHLLENAVEGEALRRIDFHTHYKFFFLQLLPELAFGLALRNGSGFGHRFHYRRCRMSLCRTERFDGFRHRANVRRRRAAATT